MNKNDIETARQKAGTPAIRLVPSNINSLSKIGGMPDVPKGFEWPTWKELPLSFIAQIDLASLPPLPTLPALPQTGLLYFFYDQEQTTWGFDLYPTACTAGTQPATKTPKRNPWQPKPTNGSCCSR